MISPARRLAFKVLLRIESGKHFSDDLLNSSAMEELELRDRRLTTEIVYGTLRLQGLLDYVLAPLSSKPWADVEQEPKILLRMSLYQLWHMDRIPDHALVNDAVELAKSRGKGIDRFVNAILRRLTRVRPWRDGDCLRDAPPWVRVSLPEWLWRRWAERFGESAAFEYGSALNRPPQAAYRLSEEAVSETVSDLVPGAGIASERASDLQYQDEASQLIPHLLGASAGWKVWDACAAPGGKAAILAGICGESGLVVASDLKTRRVFRMAEMLKGRLHMVVLDAAQPSPFRSDFDGVLADVPCSGLGTLRRNPEIKWRFRPDEFQALQKRQIRILESVAENVRIGGRLLYSTCSTEPEENEQVVESFLRSHPEFSPEAPSSPPGIDDWIGRDLYVRTFPSSRLWDGFFAALMVRKCK